MNKYLHTEPCCYVTVQIIRYKGWLLKPLFNQMAYCYGIDWWRAHFVVSPLATESYITASHGGMLFDSPNSFLGLLDKSICLLS